MTHSRLVLEQNPGSRERAAASLQAAAKTARDQGARGLELRAVSSLSRILDEAGRRQEAHEQLATIVEGFSEGADTDELREANALLAALR